MENNKFDKWNEMKKEIHNKETDIYFNQWDIWSMPLS